MRRISRELSHRFGRQPNRLELASAMGIEPRELEDLISQSAPCASLDAHARGEEDRSTLGELIPDPNGEEPMEGMDRSIQKEHLGGWLSQLNEREQKILKLRFGLGGEEPLTLAEIGRQINVSRERVRQLEAKAILKLRAMTNHQQAALSHLLSFTGPIAILIWMAMVTAGAVLCRRLRPNKRELSRKNCAHRNRSRGSFGLVLSNSFCGCPACRGADHCCDGVEPPMALHPRR